MRYQGQGHEISVPIPSGTLKEEHLRVVQESFDREYTRLYHRTIPGARVEGLNWRLLVTGPNPKINLKREMERTSPETALKGTRPVYFSEAGGFIETKIYDRYRLSPEATIEGPAVIEERESTAVLGPGCSATIDDYLNLIVELG